MTFAPFVAGNVLTAAQLNAVVPAASVIYLASGSFTSTNLAGHAWIKVRVWGPGGGGAGAAANAAGNSSSGAGGGGGAYAEAIIDASTLSLPVTVTVGTGGAGGVAGANGANGSAASSFGALVVAGLGTGGAFLATGLVVGASAFPGAGGTASAGDLKVIGADGGVTWRVTATVTVGGTGGAGAMGGGFRSGGIGANIAGQTSYFPGGGGGGACATAAGGPLNGAAGANGLVIIELL